MPVLEPARGPMRPMTMDRIPVTILVLLLLSACGAEAASGAGSPLPAASASSASRCLSSEPDMKATDDYSGMSEEKALALAERRATGRVVERDGECLDRTDDLRHGRVNFVVVDGRVVHAAVEQLR